MEEVHQPEPVQKKWALRIRLADIWATSPGGGALIHSTSASQLREQQRGSPFRNQTRERTDQTIRHSREHCIFCDLKVNPPQPSQTNCRNRKLNSSKCRTTSLCHPRPETWLTSRAHQVQEIPFARRCRKGIQTFKNRKLGIGAQLDDNQNQDKRRRCHNQVAAKKGPIFGRGWHKFV